MLDSLCPMVVAGCMLGRSGSDLAIQHSIVMEALHARLLHPV